MTNTLSPLEDPFEPAIAEILKHYPQQNGYLLALFRTFANSERFLQKGVPNLLDKESPLPLRIREIVILRITARNNCEYEWGVHVTAFAKHAQLTEEQIAATRNGAADAPCWARDEQTLIAAIDDLCDTGAMKDKTRDAFQAAWSAEEQLEIMALCGAYHTVSFVANVAGLPNEPFGAAFPD